MTNNKPMLEELDKAMGELEGEMTELAQRGRAIAKRTALLVKATVLLTLVIATINFSLIFSFSGEMTHTVDHLVNMYERFGTMSEDMQSITGAVSSMGENTVGIPTIAGSMVAMEQDMQGMQQDLTGMTRHVMTMGASLAPITVNVGSMSQRFLHLNHKVHGMGHDMGTMSWPMRMMPGMTR